MKVNHNFIDGIKRETTDMVWRCTKNAGNKSTKAITQGDSASMGAKMRKRTRCAMEKLA